MSRTISKHNKCVHVDTWHGTVALPMVDKDTNRANWPKKEATQEAASLSHLSQDSCSPSR